jgi:hypothetical protein
MKQYATIFRDFDDKMVSKETLRKTYGALHHTQDKINHHLQSSKVNKPKFSNQTWIRSYCSLQRFNVPACSSHGIHPRILLSYTYFSTNSHTQCNKNYEAFSSLLPTMRVSNRNIQYVLSLIDSNVSSVPHSDLWDNVSNFENKGADVFIHAKVAALYSFNHDYYFFMNCGSRGPYVHDWSCPFVNRFQKIENLGIVGTHISREIDEHVQTHAFMMPLNVTREILYPLWREPERIGRSLLTKDFVVSYEIRLSQKIKDRGYKLNALSNEPFELLNPAGQVSDPYSTVFQKYGGEILLQRTHLMQLDKYDECKDVFLHFYEKEIHFPNIIARPSDVEKHCCRHLNFENYHKNTKELSIMSKNTENRKHFREWMESQWPKQTIYTTKKILISISYIERERFRKNTQFVISNLKMINSKNVVKIIVVNGMLHNLIFDEDDVFAIFRRKNTGFDFGAYAFVLDFLDVRKNNPYQFDKFLFLNGGVQGPFIPVWYSSLQSTWLNAFFPTDSRVALVTTAVTCIQEEDLCVKYGLTKKNPKANSFVFSITNNEILNKLIDRDIFKQHMSKTEAICNGEYKMSDVIHESSYTMKSLQLAYQWTNWSNKLNHNCNDNEFSARNNKYFGISLSPFETLFHKREWGDDVPYNERFVRKEETKRYVSWRTGHIYF